MADWAVDEIVEVPERTLLREYGYVPNPNPNQTKKRRRKTAKQRALEEASRYVEIPMLEPFLGHENLLVRTALIRSKRFPESRRWLPKVDTPKRAAHLCYHMSAYDQEHMVVLATDQVQRLLAIHELSIGTRSQTVTNAQDVVKVPLLTSAISAIMVHNHPSGRSAPSSEDRMMTEAVNEACNCVGISLLDSIVVAEEGWASIIMNDDGNWDQYLIESMKKARR